MVNTHSLYRTFYIRYQIYLGTAFTFERDAIQYLATVGHIFPHAQNGDEIEFSIMQNNARINFNSKIFKHPDLAVDIAILTLPNDISNRYPINLSIANLKLSQETYFLGFPLGRFMEDTSYLNNGYPIPFVKKGIFSSLPFHKDGLQLMYIDGMNNPGFSGGPCIFFTQMVKPLLFAVL